ncbi:helix-turn-helix domain-containing protein [Olivibacter sp. XZL3]|uniref:helix-turn-helix domain-containing protein n=1 Tax=Olivibacter sp. XZL3 TaxID=1735116 RepID=UPI001416F247|nr:helix-turn-helix transcriptional regulator [Olivibacter sp. XZL3]
MAKKSRKEAIFRIGAILAEQGVKKQVFAELVGVNTGTVSEWINHKTYPETNKLPLIAKILNVDIRELLISTPTKSGKSEAQVKSHEKQ